MLNVCVCVCVCLFVPERNMHHGWGEEGIGEDRTLILVSFETQFFGRLVGQ